MYTIYQLNKCDPAWNRSLLLCYWNTVLAVEEEVVLN